MDLHIKCGPEGWSSVSDDSRQRPAADPMRTTSLLAGILYLLTFASVPTLALVGSFHADAAGFVLGGGSEAAARWAVVAELVVGLANIGTAVVLYPVARRQSETAALGFVATRVLESTLIFVGVACVLTLIAVRRDAAGAGAAQAAVLATTGRTLADLYDATFLVSQSLIPVLNDLLLGYVLLRGRLVPRALPIIAFVGAPLLLAADLGVLAGAYDRTAPLAALAALPVVVFELGLGLWLVVRGFDPASPLLASGGGAASRLSPERR